jgi:hypothetical protein
MKKLYSILPLLFSLAMFGQSWQWGRRGGSDNAMSDSNWTEQVRSMATDPLGNVYILSPVGVANLDIDGHPKSAYSTVSGSNASSDYMIASFSCDGTYRWSKVLGGYGEDRVVKIQTDAFGNVYAAGNFAPAYTGQTAIHIDNDLTLPVSAYSSHTFKQSLFLIKFDTFGEFQWMRMPEKDDVSMEESLNQTFNLSMETDPDGNSYWLTYLAAGIYINGTYSVSSNSIHILKYDSAGNFLNGFPINMQLQGGTALNLKMVRNHSTGTFYFSAPYTNGETVSFGGESVSHPCFLAAYDSTGQFLWKKESTVDAPGGGFAAMSLDNTGDIYLTGGVASGMTFGGHTFTSSTPHMFPFILKLNGNGDVIWGNNAVTVAVTRGQAIVPGAVTGGFGAMTWNGINVSQQINTGYDVFMARFDPATGEVNAIETLQDDDGYSDYGTALAADNNNNFYLGGKFTHLMYVNDTMPMVNDNQQTDFFIAKFGSSQCTLATPESEEALAIKIWPNPITDMVNLHAEFKGNFQLFDILGKEIKRGSFSMGTTTLYLDGIASGLYIFRVMDDAGNISSYKLLKN